MRGHVLLAVALCGCGASNDLGGELAIDSEEYGAWTVAPTRCFSGERQGFFGVDLIEGDDQSTLIRLVRDPIEGDSLALNVPGQEIAIVLSNPQGCETFDLEVERESVRINDIYNVRGHVVVACDVPGLKLDADISFASCH